MLINGAAFDPLTTELICVEPDENGEYRKVVSKYDTDMYKDTIHILNGWYQAGYIAEDAMINEEDSTQNPKIFATYGAGDIGRVYTTANNTGSAGKFSVAKLTDGWVTSFTASMLSMAIPVSATEPEAAARVMGLCYTDPEVKLLVGWGIEGEDYQYAENGGIEALPTATYAPNTSGIFGNQFLEPDTAGQAAVGVSKKDVNPDEWNFSPVYGFALNTEPVENILAQLTSVQNEYNAQIECGMADDAEYQEYIDKLYASGLQDFIDEAQRQLDEWYASQE